MSLQASGVASNKRKRCTLPANSFSTNLEMRTSPIFQWLTRTPFRNCVAGQLDRLVGRPPGMKACCQPLGVILPVNDWATILPSRTTNVSVAISYTLSAVSAVHKM